MKKIWISMMSFVIALVMFTPLTVMAENEKIKANPTSIQEACAEEQIAFDHDYKNNQKDKVNVYLFRGNGCSHCYEFLEYLTSIIDEYGKYINVVTFEVWENADNNDLLEKVASKFSEEVGGVPYIVIGKKTFSGYSSSMNEEIESLIKEEYEKDERYDVMKELGVDTTVSNEKVDNSKSSSDAVVVVVSLLIIGGIVAFAIISRRQN